MKAILDQIKEETEKFQKQTTEQVLHMFNKTKEVPPAAFLLTMHEGKFGVGIIKLKKVMIDDDGKDIAHGIIKHACDKYKPFAMAFVSEGWMVKGEKEQMEDLLDEEGNMKVRPMNHPERIETVFINFETLDKVGMQSWQIIREDGKEPRLEPLTILEEKDWQNKKDLKFHGRFSGFLNDMLMNMFTDVPNNTEIKNTDVKN